MDKVEISIDRVEQNINLNESTCPICQNIYYKPVMCNNCENHFCEACIDEWLKKNPDSCPLCKDFDRKKASILLNNILDKLKITCVYMNLGCDEILSYQGLIRHENSCNLNPNLKQEKKRNMTVYGRSSTTKNEPNNINYQSYFQGKF